MSTVRSREITRNLTNGLFYRSYRMTCFTHTVVLDGSFEMFFLHSKPNCRGKENCLPLYNFPELKNINKQGRIFRSGKVFESQRKVIEFYSELDGTLYVALTSW